MPKRARDWIWDKLVPDVFSTVLEHPKVRGHARKFRESKPESVLQRLTQALPHTDKLWVQKYSVHLAIYLLIVSPQETLQQPVVLLLVRYLEHLRSMNIKNLAPWLARLLSAISDHAQLYIPDAKLRAALLQAMPKDLAWKKGVESAERPSAREAPGGGVDAQAKVLLDKAIQDWKVDLRANDKESVIASLEERVPTTNKRTLRYVLRHASAALESPQVVACGEALPSRSDRGLQRRVRRLILLCLDSVSTWDARLVPLLQHLRFKVEKLPEPDDEKEHVMGSKQWQRLRLKLAELASQGGPLAPSASEPVSKRPAAQGPQPSTWDDRRKRSRPGAGAQARQPGADKRGANHAFGTQEVEKLLKGHQLPDLFLAYPLFRESIRQCREQYPKDFASDPKGTTLRHFEEVLRQLPDPGDAERVRRLVQGSYGNLSGRKQFCFWKIFEDCHFTNVFHRHDACNVCVEQLRQILPFRAAIPVVVLIYHTGSRPFVRHVVAEVERRHRAGKLGDLSFGSVRATLDSYLKRFTWQVQNKDMPLPELYHRRFRPMLLWNNQVRKRLAEARAAGLEIAPQCKLGFLGKLPELSTDSGGVTLTPALICGKEHALSQLRGRSILDRLMDYSAEHVAESTCFPRDGQCRDVESQIKRLLERCVSAKMQWTPPLQQATETRITDRAVQGGCAAKALKSSHLLRNAFKLNLANLLEPWLPSAAQNKESEDNGLGPGFRQMAHICQGKGKQGESEPPLHSAV
ncbi:unnamed protein product [Symbiodinium natans]|uniref:Uncharacterized protein n=1 Tax=Symbiodinium natans TaxID=878477 RepID=A0A812QKA5_9DINO|nr:unnamed protein product [Symbiodinium natans]